MAIPLSSAEVAHLENAQRTLLSPLAYDTTANWWAAASSAIRTLFSSEYVYTYLDCPGDPPFYTERLDPPEVAGHSDAIAPMPASQRGPFAFGIAHARPLLPGLSRDASVPQPPRNGVPLTRPWQGDSLTVYREDRRGASGDLVLASVGLYHAPSQSSATVEQLSGLLRLLHPAFDSGVRMAARLHSGRHALAAALDGIGKPVFLAGPQGEPIHTTSALTALLETDPEREVVLERVRELAGRVVRLAWARPVSDAAHMQDLSLPRGWQVVELISTTATSYRARAVSLGEALLGRQAVAVTVERLSPEPAPPTEAPRVSETYLYDEYGLTPQEARVALLLAERKRNAEIASALCVSPHTARHHTEHVLEKLGVHSRDEVRDLLERSRSAKE